MAAAPTRSIAARSSFRTSPISASINRIPAARRSRSPPKARATPTSAWTRTRSRLIGVREQRWAEHDRRDVPADVLVEGADFYSDPIVSPDGKFLAWLQWNHPNMPWDGTELWVAVINPDGSIGSREKIAGGAERIDLPAGVVARRRVVLRLGSHRLVESVSLAPCDLLRVAKRRASDGGGVRQAAVDVQHGHLCVRRREPHRGDVYRRRHAGSWR